MTDGILERVGSLLGPAVRPRGPGIPDLAGIPDLTGFPALTSIVDLGSLEVLPSGLGDAGLCSVLLPVILDFNDLVALEDFSIWVDGFPSLFSSDPRTGRFFSATVLRSALEDRLLFKTDDGRAADLVFNSFPMTGFETVSLRAPSLDPTSLLAAFLMAGCFATFNLEVDCLPIFALFPSLAADDLPILGLIVRCVGSVFSSGNGGPVLVRLPFERGVAIDLPVCFAFDLTLLSSASGVAGTRSALERGSVEMVLYFPSFSFLQDLTGVDMLPIGCFGLHRGVAAVGLTGVVGGSLIRLITEPSQDRDFLGLTGRVLGLIG